MVVDEGCKSLMICEGCKVVHELYPAGFTRQFGSVVASPGIAEKGFINVLVEVTAPGGHSSIPPAHTVISFFIASISLIKSLQSIGILSALLVHYEKHPYEVNIVSTQEVIHVLQPLPDAIFHRERMNPFMIPCNALPSTLNLSHQAYAKSSNVLPTQRRPFMLSRPSFAKIMFSEA